MQDRWLEQLREIHAEALEIDWDSRLSELNARYGLYGDHALSTADTGIPPAWFNGDVECVQSGKWVLVVSLNPSKPPPGYYGGELTADTAWNFWRRHNTDWWNSRFFRPLVRLAATALGEPIPDQGAGERQFATERMVFVEICPYVSKKFEIAPMLLEELRAIDMGFHHADRVRRILLDHAEPALVLINGEPAIREFQRTEQDRLRWRRREYQSFTETRKSGEPKPLWHLEGWLDALYGPIPIGGFKFLRKQHNHNGYAEIEQLGLALKVMCSQLEKG